MNSRLIRTQTFTVPAASQFPCLRFWHWYDFTIWASSDYGVVEIRVGTGAWQAVSPQYTGSSGDWTCADIDLSRFAGQTVQLAFHAVDTNGKYPDVGWYVDDISFITGTPVLNNPEGFETGIGDWYADQGIWQVGSATKTGGATKDGLGAQAHTGYNCAVTVLNANYPLTMNSRFISPPFILPPASSNPYLRFWHWYNFTTWGSSDYGVVEIKVGANAWQPVSPQYTNNSGNWTQPLIYLTSFGGQTVQLAFHAECINGGYTGIGWYVDDVQIYPPPTPVGPTNILSSIPSTNIDILALWEYTPIIDGTAYTFGLSNAPSGMTVAPSSGTISWTPTWEQATYTYSNITYIVYYQSGALAASTSFNVTVTDVNVSPVATATAVVTYGYVVGATVTYGGFGYTNTPGVRIIGGGGSGAQAVAVVSNGVLTAVNIPITGSGYTSTPLVIIEPPFIPNPVLSIAPMSFLSFSNLSVGGVYQLQQLEQAYYWSNQPVSFIATNAQFTDIVPGMASSGDYRLAVTPLPPQAFATAQVVNGHIIAVNLTSGGSGYVTIPAVKFADSTGSNATAVASIYGGVVTNIAITSTGNGYTAPTVEIGAPPVVSVSPKVLPMMMIKSTRLAPYHNYQLQFTPGLRATWVNWNGGLFGSTDVVNTQVFFITNNTGFFRLQYLP